MNFGAHVCVVDRLDHHDPAELVGLGATLPDLAAMGRYRLRRPSGNEGIDAGVTLHYRTDDVFHSHRLFLQWQRTVGAALVGSDLSRGASRAVAHIGPEILLDGVLLGAAHNRVAVGRALGAVGLVRAELLPMVNAPDNDAWGTHLDDVAAWPMPDSLGNAGTVAARIQRILSRRPRLAFDPDGTKQVEMALLTVVESIEANAEQLTDDVSASVAALT